MNGWLEEGKYLPKCMQSFHDCKKLFRRIQWLVEEAKKEKDSINVYAKMIPSWQLNHIYVVDFFLWFMAKRGYTLQKNRTKLDFMDLDQSISELEKQEEKMFAQAFNKK